MGGIGSRFSQEGFMYPKPLIRILGRPMIFWVIETLTITEEDTVWVGIDEDINDQYDLYQSITTEFPSIRFRFVPLLFSTRGAVETIFVILQHMSGSDLDKKTISIDCDTIYWEDPISIFRQRDRCMIFYSNVALDSPPIFSYITMDTQSFVLDIAEKQALSEHACTGAYAFSSGHLLKHHCTTVLDRPITKEYYTSGVVKEMISNNVPFYACKLDSGEFDCVGTPSQLTEFIKKVTYEQPYLIRSKLRFCFDLDNTLVTHPRTHGDYASVKPIPKAIEIVRKLYSLGHTIIIFTARRMHNPVTYDTLDKFDIPFHEIYFGKPYAHVYIDDSAFNPHTDPDHVHYIGCTSDVFVREEVNRNVKVHRFVEPRSFNRIKIHEQTVVKASSDDSLRGELYFYQHIPEDLQRYFPRLLQYRDDGNRSITIDRVDGVAMSHLLVSRCVTEHRLHTVLSVLHTIHTFPVETVDPTLLDNAYNNYGQKLIQRYESHKDVYLALDPFAESTFSTLRTYLANYQDRNAAKISALIHGDPVFSNVIITGKNEVKLIDMRGMLGGTLALGGDLVYDLAKVLQSLNGYDYVITGRQITPDDLQILCKLQQYFWGFVREHYKDIHIVDVKTICASLLFSLIPLHSNTLHQKEFMRMCKSVISDALL